MEFEPLEFGLVMPTNGTPENVDPSSLDADRRLELIVSIIVPIFFSLIGITGFIGNLLVIITVLFNQNMRGSTNLYLLNLSIADLLFVVFCIPFTVSLQDNFFFLSLINWFGIIFFRQLITALQVGPLEICGAKWFNI